MVYTEGPANDLVFGSCKTGRIILRPPSRFPKCLMPFEERGASSLFLAMCVQNCWVRWLLFAHNLRGVETTVPQEPMAFEACQYSPDFGRLPNVFVGF